MRDCIPRETPARPELPAVIHATGNLKAGPPKSAPFRVLRFHYCPKTGNESFPKSCLEPYRKHRPDPLRIYGALHNWCCRPWKGVLEEFNMLQTSVSLCVRSLLAGSVLLALTFRPEIGRAQTPSREAEEQAPVLPRLLPPLQIDLQEFESEVLPEFRTRIPSPARPAISGVESGPTKNPPEQTTTTQYVPVDGNSSFDGTTGGPLLPPPVSMTASCLPTDYWIVSSRDCRPRDQKRGSSACLKYFHRTPEQGLFPTDHATFTSSLSPEIPVCFVIHGSFNRWSDIVNESRLINRWIRSATPDQPLQIVFFTWPSNGYLTVFVPLEVNMLGRRSSRHALYLAQMITELPPQQAVSLIGHSHGARNVASTMHLLAGGSIEGGYRMAAGAACPRRIRAVLMAPAIDHHWLNPGERYGMALHPPEKVLIVRNPCDLPLAFYVLRKPFGAAALGRSGLSQHDRMQLDGLNAKLSELDGTPFAGSGHAWSNYYMHPGLASGLISHLNFQDGFAGESAAPSVQPLTTIRPAAPVLPAVPSADSTGSAP